MDKEEILRQWFKRGEEEIISAEYLSTMRHPTPDETICYLCQQSAEKYLKGSVVVKIENRKIDTIDGITDYWYELIPEGWAFDGYLVDELPIVISESDLEFSNGVITKYNGNASSIIIPREINGQTVTEIGHQAFTKKQLTSVVIPNSVTNIRNLAFYDNQLTSITIGVNVKTGEMIHPGYMPAFDDDFDAVYNSKAAGTYIYKDGVWSLNGTVLLSPPSSREGRPSYYPDWAWSEYKAFIKAESEYVPQYGTPDPNDH